MLDQRAAQASMGVFAPDDMPRRYLRIGRR
jgi:hypothetical protein